jgi:hypothetical protein
MRRLRKAALSTAAAGVLAMGATLGASAPAEASANLHACKTAYGVYTCIDGKVYGGGLYIDDFELHIFNSQWPSFVGCQVHMHVWNDQTGANKRSWNTISSPCTDINSNNAFRLDIWNYVPKGKYCATLYFQQTATNYADAGAACAQVY